METASAKPEFEDSGRPSDSSERPGRVVWELAWPVVALNSLQVFNTLLDRGYIGHLSRAALTAQGGANSMMFLMFSLAVALATGSTALVARAYGAGDKHEYRLAARQALRLAIVCGIGIGLLTMAIAYSAAGVLLPATDHESIREMGAFLVVYGTGLPAIFVIQVLAGSLRGIGDSRSPMVISGIQIFLHMALNSLLIFPTHNGIPGAGWGLTGAAAAFAISASLSAIVYVIYVKRTPLGPVWSFPWPERDWAVRILRIAVPAASAASLRVFSFMTFNIILSVMREPDGSNSIAAMNTAIGIESIMIMPAFGVSAAAGALVGQSLGMKRPDRAEKLGWTAGTHGAIVTVVLAIPIFIFARQLTALLVPGHLEISLPAAALLRSLAVTEVGFAYAMILFGAMQGAGDTTRPMWISFIGLWLLRVPMALFLVLPSGQVLLKHPLFCLPFGLGLGMSGAWFAMAFTQMIQGVLAFGAFKQGAWKLKKV